MQGGEIGEQHTPSFVIESFPSRGKHCFPSQRMVERGRLISHSLKKLRLFSFWIVSLYLDSGKKIFISSE